MARIEHGCSSYAREGYVAYCEARGKEPGLFGDLPEAEQRAWCEAAKAIILSRDDDTAWRSIGL